MHTPSWWNYLPSIQELDIEHVALDCFCHFYWTLNVMLLTTSIGCLAIGFSGTFTHFLRSGFEGSDGTALFCLSSKVWFILLNHIWCHRGKPPSAPSKKLVHTNFLVNIHMYTVDLNPQRLVTRPISPNFTKTNRNSDGNNLLNELYCWKMTKDSTKGELIERITD